MKHLICLLILASTPCIAAESPELVAAGEKRREEIPLGGDFKPVPKVPTFVVCGHGGRILVSKDDGKTWKQMFCGADGADHGVWATRTMTYGGGLFVVAFGWGAPTSYLASEDGVNWRHLTSGQTKLPASKGNPRIMPGAWGLAAGKGTFVGTGYMDTAATSDLGKTFTGFSLYSLKNDPRGKFQTHHLDPVYCGDASGRFLALGDNRGKEGPKFGHLFASDDLGKTWQWLAPKGLDASTGRGSMVSNGKVLVMTDAGAANTWTSTDAGETWTGPHPTGTKGRNVLSVVRGEFWLAGNPRVRALTAKRGATFLTPCLPARSSPAIRERSSASTRSAPMSSAVPTAGSRGRKSTAMSRPPSKAVPKDCAMERLDTSPRNRPAFPSVPTRTLQPDHSIDACSKFFLLASHIAQRFRRDACASMDGIAPLVESARCGCFHGCCRERKSPCTLWLPAFRQRGESTSMVGERRRRGHGVVEHTTAASAVQAAHYCTEGSTRLQQHERPTLAAVL